MINGEDLVGEPDLDKITCAVERERRIRDGMARTGEGREVVAEMIDATDAMGQEAVLDLMDGQPTTLTAALARWLELVGDETLGLHAGALRADLMAILEYPWSGEEERVQLHEANHSLLLHVTEGDDRDTEIRMGSNRHLVYTVGWEDAGSGGQLEAVNAARAVHRAVLNRVIADRDHSVQLNAREALSLVQWAINSHGGSWSPSVRSRLSVDAVEGGGLLVRTRPYTFQQPGHAVAARQEELARPIDPEQIEKIRRAVGEQE